MTHYTTLIERCRRINLLLADEIEAEFRRLEKKPVDGKEVAKWLNAQGCVPVKHARVQLLEIWEAQMKNRPAPWRDWIPSVGELLECMRYNQPSDTWELRGDKLEQLARSLPGHPSSETHI